MQNSLSRGLAYKKLCYSIERSKCIKEDYIMGRPKKTPDDLKTVCLRVSGVSWDKFKQIANSLQMSRSRLIEFITDNEIPIGDYKRNEEKNKA
ncbi:MAG: hypothetical protein ACKPJO_00015, partial [Dolichospermum sp.]